MAKKQKNKPVRLKQALVLNSFILDLFGAASLETFSEHLKDPALEKYDENNVSYFCHELMSRLFRNSNFTKEMLLEYDQNIFRHTQIISEKRKENIQWKYFQYLALLFTEIYLDRYFNHRANLLEDINRFLVEKFRTKEDAYHDISLFTLKDLNKLAFWNATGSGKTLLMHINILQFYHYSKQKDLNKVFLLTPNEGLSKQHLIEFELSSIHAKGFSKNDTPFHNNPHVEVIEITKLSETSGEKTVAVDSFEENNLVLVDEGHRGSSGDVWKKMRDKLSTNGFSFEYSATFGQAISAANGAKREELLNEYGKATLFDYSYKYFYNDGYGKNYRILNINDIWNENMVTRYLIASLLTFYEQMKLYLSEENSIRSFLLEKPLSIYVGSSVTAVRTVGKREVSDVIEILRFFEKFINNRKESIVNIARLIGGEDGLIDKNNRPIFNNQFHYLKLADLTAEAIYEGILSTLFNSNISGAKLHLDNLKGQEGEIGLRIGNSEYFGVISVGDDAKLLKLCADNGLSTFDKDFANRSLFADINNPDSKINILIGSKKFNTGWSSWRVASMCLLNVGRGEGSEIIQLFGRGVRLKGYGYSLKRSNALDFSICPPQIPSHISLLETLNIFGIHADYMEQFKQYLEEEGVPTNDSHKKEIALPVVPNPSFCNTRLKYIKIKEGHDFKKEKTVILDAKGNGVSVFLNYYPKVQILKSQRKATDALEINLNQGILTPKHLAFVDWDKVYFALLQYKKEKCWYNLNISKSVLKEIAFVPGWYDLRIPATDLMFDNFSKRTKMWQDILITLLKLYTERCYNIAKSKWISENVVIAFLDENNPNFIKEYQISIHQDLENIIEKTYQLKTQLKTKQFSANFKLDVNFEALFFSQHLYQPLLYIPAKEYVANGSKFIDVKPIALNEGEKTFLEDLKLFYDTDRQFFQNKELYILRNQSKKGIGFFESNGFYPDFIVWLLVEEKQYITFIDPKGIRNLREGMNSPKIQLHKYIREKIEKSLKDKTIILNSFIVSNTPFKEVDFWKEGETIASFNTNHVFFEKEQKDYYISKIFHSIIQSSEAM